MNWHGVVFTAACVCLLAGTACAQTVDAVLGQVEVVRGSATLAVQPPFTLHADDVLASADGGEALLGLPGGGRLVLRGGSRMQWQRHGARAKSIDHVVRVITGQVRYASGGRRGGRRLAFATASATIGIRGTDIEIAVIDSPSGQEPAGTYLRVREGIVSMRAEDGSQLQLREGETGVSTEPALAPRGPGGARRPAARRAEGAAAIFRPGQLDALIR